MALAFNETKNFMQYRDEYFVTDGPFSALQQVLLSNPEAGSVMRGCGGLRKIRWPDARRGKGKRGGLRIVYLYLPEFQRVVFLDVYDKDEADDLTPEERKEMTEIAHAIRIKFQHGVQQKGQSSE